MEFYETYDEEISQAAEALKQKVVATFNEKPQSRAKTAIHNPYINKNTLKAVNQDKSKNWSSVLANTYNLDDEHKNDLGCIGY